MTSLPDGAGERGRWRDRRAVSADEIPSAPPGYRIVEIDTPSCDHLRDVVSRRWDFESTRLFCESFLAADLPSGYSERRQAEGMWIAAVVTYGRAFNQGVRHLERPDVSTLNPEEHELHDYVLALRNRHFAHSVSRYEDVIPLAYLTNSAFAPRQITRTGQTHLSLYSGDPELAAGLQGLASKFVRACDLRARALHAQIGEELAQLPLDVVYGLDDLSIRPPERGDVHRRR